MLVCFIEGYRVWANSANHSSESQSRKLGTHISQETKANDWNSVCVYLVTQSCLILCNLMECSLPGSSVMGILQARILEWIVIPSSRGSSQPRDQTQVSCIAVRFLTIWATREAWKSRNHNVSSAYHWKWAIMTYLYYFLHLLCYLNCLQWASILLLADRLLP